MAKWKSQASEMDLEIQFYLVIFFRLIVIQFSTEVEGLMKSLYNPLLNEFLKTPNRCHKRLFGFF